MPADNVIRADIMALVKMKLRIMGTIATPSTKYWLDRTYQCLGETIRGFEGLKSTLEEEQREDSASSSRD